MLEVLVYIIYCFMLYTVYCFGIGAKSQSRSMMCSNLSTLRVLFFIKSSIHVSYLYIATNSINVEQFVFYTADTLLIFLITKFIYEHISYKLRLDNEYE